MEVEEERDRVTVPSTSIDGDRGSRGDDTYRDTRPRWLWGAFAPPRRVPSNQEAGDVVVQVQGDSWAAAHADLVVDHQDGAVFPSVAGPSHSITRRHGWWTRAAAAIDTSSHTTATTPAVTAEGDGDSARGIGEVELGDCSMVENALAHARSNNDNSIISMQFDSNDDNGANNRDGDEKEPKQEGRLEEEEEEERYCRICLETVSAEDIAADDATALGCSCFSGRGLLRLLSHFRMSLLRKGSIDQRHAIVLHSRRSS